MMFPTEVEKVEELILEYSLHNDMYQVIKGFTSRKGPEYFLNLRGTTIPDILMFSPTVSAIVKKEEVQYFYKVIEMLKRMHAEQPQAVRSHRFYQAMVVLKIKALLYDVSHGVKLSKLLSKLDEYFPKTTEVINQHQKAAMGCRNLLRNLIFSQSEERVRMREILENQYSRKFMRKFQASIQNMLKDFKATLPVPILQQVVYECENSQTFHNLPLSSSSVLDKLIQKCLQSAPSEDTLLLFLEEIWNAKTPNEQNDYLEESQIYNFLCSSSFMESMSFEDSQIFQRVSSQSVSESNDSSVGVISSSLKTGSDATNKSSEEVSESIQSSGSSKSFNLLRKPFGVTTREDHITANTEGKYINPEMQKKHTQEPVISSRDKMETNMASGQLNSNGDGLIDKIQTNELTSKKGSTLVLSDNKDHPSQQEIHAVSLSLDFSNSDIADSGKITKSITRQVDNDDSCQSGSVSETSFALVTPEMQCLFEYSAIIISDDEDEAALEDIVIDEKDGEGHLKRKGTEMKEKEMVKGRGIKEKKKMANFEELHSRFDPGSTSTQCQNIHKDDVIVHVNEYFEVGKNADSESEEMSF